MSPRFLLALLWAGVLIAAPVALLAVPTHVLDRGPTLCLFRNLFGVHCPGCGMTRAFSSVLHGHFWQAMRYNPLIVIVMPLMSWLWVGWLRAAVRDVRKRAPRRAPRRRLASIVKATRS